MLDTARYWLALFSLVFWPAALTVWFIIHPFIGLWRRVGPFVAYPVAFSAALAVGYGIVQVQHSVLSVEFGAHGALLAAGAIIFAISQGLNFWVRRSLTLPTLFGLPELKGQQDAASLITTGAFALVRHPRYSALMLGLLGAALFTNYLAVYVMATAMLPMINMLAIIEERELRTRFGDAYQSYAKRTPRFFPRILPRQR